MDRNLNPSGRGKYALLLLRKLGPPGSLDMQPDIADAIDTLDKAGLIEWGETGTEGEFFVIKLKDQNAPASLFAYGNEAHRTDPEWAEEVFELARRSQLSPWRKRPD